MSSFVRSLPSSGLYTCGVQSLGPTSTTTLGVPTKFLRTRGRVEKSKARKAGGHRCKRISAVGRQEDGEKCGNDALSSHCSRQLYPITPVPPPPYRPDRVCARGPELRCGRSRSSPESIYPLRSFTPSLPIISPYLSPPLIFQFCPPISSLSSRFRERATDRSSSHQIIAKISRGGATTRLPRAHSGNVQQVGVSSAHAALPTQLATFFSTDFASSTKRLLVYEHREEGARFTFLRASGSNFEGSNETGGRGGGGGINR